MIEKKLKEEACLSCSHFGFCLVRWGIDCKRQGGNKIPRMKPIPVEERWMVDKQESKRPRRKPRQQTREMFERISTKVTNW
jgi:hypothetical protein